MRRPDVIKQERRNEEIRNIGISFVPDSTTEIIHEWKLFIIMDIYVNKIFMLDTRIPHHILLRSHNENAIQRWKIKKVNQEMNGVRLIFHNPYTNALTLKLPSKWYRFRSRAPCSVN